MQSNQSSFSISQCKVIVGLGNPGSKFTYTRHNIGFLCVDFIAEKYGASWKAGQDCLLATITVGDQQVVLVKPQTFMNSSGAVWRWLSKKGITAEQMLVVHDELEKKFGSIHIRLGGSARGHNGLRSFIAACGENFWRLRIGIDRPADKNQVASYVLERFPATEQAQFDTVFQNALQQLSL